jgi:hypothetical protein
MRGSACRIARRCACGAARSGSTISRCILADPDTLALASRLIVIADTNPDPNAMTPIRVELDLAEGRTIACDVAEVLGSPARPLPPDAARAKFAACGAPDALWDAVMSLGPETDITALAALIAG